MGKQEVYRTMLTLNKFSLCVAVLGLLVAIVIGILQLQRSKQSRQQPPTVKTTIVHTQDKTGGQPATAGSPVQAPTKAAEPVKAAKQNQPQMQTPTQTETPGQASQPKEPAGSSTTTPKSKKPKARIIPNSTSTVPPKESHSSK